MVIKLNTVMEQPPNNNTEPKPEGRSLASELGEIAAVGAATVLVGNPAGVVVAAGIVVAKSMVKHEITGLSRAPR
mgnify:CR=1 FL=1